MQAATKRDPGGSETQHALEQHEQAGVPLAASLKKYDVRTGQQLADVVVPGPPGEGGFHHRQDQGLFVPVTSASSLKNARFLSLLRPQLTGTLW